MVSCGTNQKCFWEDRKIVYLVVLIVVEILCLFCESLAMFIMISGVFLIN